MLVYCNNLVLNPPDSVNAVLRCIAVWAGKRSKGYVDPKALLTDGRINLKDGSRLTTETTIEAARPPTFPVVALTSLTHPDSEVSGRQWATEIGYRQINPTGPVETSIYLETREIGAGINDPIQVTRPRIVEDLIASCNPDPNTAGLLLKELRTRDAVPFFRQATDPQRRFAMIVISPTREGDYLVNADRLRSLALGLAQVFVIPRDEDTRVLEDALTPKYAAYLGAVNVIYPLSPNQRLRETYRYVPDQIEEMRDDGKNPESEVLSAITHRFNLPHSWQRITSYTVADAKFRKQLEATVQKAQESQKRQRESHENELDQVKRELAEKSADLDVFLELTTAEINTKNGELNSLKEAMAASNEAVAALSDQVRELESANEAIKFALHEKSPPMATALNEDRIRDAIVASLTKGIADVEDMLRLVAAAYPDRIVVLDSALKSARASHVFRSPERALKLLLDLAGAYWQSLAEGKGDGEARKVFGAAYAASETDVLSKEGLRRRTFQYKGSSVEMLMHLKIGVKDAVAETLRIHFEWFADEKKIVIGHCGRHLKL